MSDLSIGNGLAQNQILQFLQQQLVGNADSNSTGAPVQQDGASTGQSLPGGTDSPAVAPSTTGASQPAIDPQTALALLKIQESQMMASSDTLIFGDSGTAGGSSTGDPLLDGFGGGGAATQTDPLQAIIDQMTRAPGAVTSGQFDPTQVLSALSAMTGSASGTSAAQASNQSLLDILNETAATESSAQTNAE
jgi:hypothetical protein